MKERKPLFPRELPSASGTTGATLSEKNGEKPVVTTPPPKEGWGWLGWPLAVGLVAVVMAMWAVLLD